MKKIDIQPDKDRGIERDKVTLTYGDKETEIQRWSQLSDRENKDRVLKIKRKTDRQRKWEKRIYRQRDRGKRDRKTEK